jgi:hypothetical protein
MASIAKQQLSKTRVLKKFNIKQKKNALNHSQTSSRHRATGKTAATYFMK